MKLQIGSVPVESLAKEYRRFIAWSGSKLWSSKIKNLQSTPKFSNLDFYGKYLANRNPLTAAVAEFLALDSSGKSIPKNTSRQLLEMGGPVYIMNRLVHLLGDSVQRRVTGILRDDDNIRAFLFELQIATHFFRRGYDIQFADLKNLGNYDLLVSDGSLEIEIECKRKSVDAGRRIPRFSLYMLTDMLLARFENFSDHILITVTSGARLQANQAQLSDLANQIHEAFKKDMTSRSLGQVTFTIERLALTGAIKNDEDAARVLSPYWSDGAHFAISSNREHTLVLKCQGVKRDEVLTAIYEELKGAADQLSKTRPALIACFIEELDDSAWGRLAEKSGLQVMTHKLFDNPERSHVSLVVYSSDQTPPKEDGEGTEFYSTTLSFRNPVAKFPLDPSFLRGEKA